MIVPNKARMQNGLIVEFWDRKSVLARLTEMGDTLKRLQMRGLRPAGFKSSMPDYVRSYWDEWAAAFDSKERRWRAPVVRPGPPSASAISRMDEALFWPELIETGNKEETVMLRYVLWGLAFRHRKAHIAKAVGCARPTIYRLCNRSLDLVAQSLNGQATQFATVTAAVSVSQPPEVVTLAFD